MLIPVEIFAIRKDKKFYSGNEGEDSFTDYAKDIKIFDCYEDAIETIYSDIEQPMKCQVVSGLGILKVDERLL